MAGEQGFEPWYAGIKIQCLNQLGDSPTQLTATRACRRFYRQKSREAKFYSITRRPCNSACIGCRASDLACHARHAGGTCSSTRAASASLENAQNTHAPEPVMR